MLQGHIGTYSELAECEGHLPTITADLDKHRAVATKDPSYFFLQFFVTHCLGKAAKSCQYS